MKNKPVFIHSLFRTGSTYVWNKFRQSDKYYCYYEPLHQNMAKVTAENIESLLSRDYNAVSHPHLSQYYLYEYKPLLTGVSPNIEHNKNQSPGLPFFKKSFSFDEFCFNEENPDLKRYIDYLLAGAGERVPVLQFNRSALRIQWFKKYYPQALHLYLVRDPRHQWQSYWDIYKRTGYAGFFVMDLWIAGANRYTDYFRALERSVALCGRPGAGENEEAYYHSQPDQYTDEEKYMIFYYTWLRSLLENVLHADFILDMNGLIPDPQYREKVAEFLAQQGIEEVDFADAHIKSYSPAEYKLKPRVMKKIEDNARSLVLSTMPGDRIEDFFKRIPPWTRKYYKFKKNTFLALKKQDIPGAVRCLRLADLPAAARGRMGWPWTEESPALPDQMPGGSPWPKITIVTPSYNQGQYLEETIRSVLLQGYPNLDYIVMDGGSTDNSADIIKKYEPWLTFWVSEKDRGQGHAVNKGWELAKPGIWAWLNSDDTYQPGTFLQAVTALTNNPGAQAVYAAASHTDENSRHLYYYYGRPLPEGLRRFCFWKGWNIPQATVFFHSEVVRKYGGLDETFHLALDYELFTRWAKDVEFTCCDSVWAAARLHSLAKTGDWKKNKPHFFKETRLANKKNTHWFRYYYLRFLEILDNRKEKRLKKKQQVLAAKGKTFTVPYEWGSIIQLGKRGNSGPYRKGGWFEPDVYGTWTGSGPAKLIIPLRQAAAHDVILRAELKAFLSPGRLEKQRVKVVVNGCFMGLWHIEDPGYQWYTILIPLRCLAKHRLMIEFILPEAAAPSSLGVNDDKRMLGIHVRAVELRQYTQRTLLDNVGPVEPTRQAQQTLHTNVTNVRALELPRQAQQSLSSWRDRPDLKTIVFVREVFNWMGTHSAYDPLCRYVEDTEDYRTCGVFRSVKPRRPSLRTSLYSSLHSRIDPNPFYNTNSLVAEISAFRKSRRFKAGLIHVMYGENNFGLLGRLKKMQPAKLVVTFHQTPEWWEENHRKKNSLKGIDGIIVVSETQVEYFERLAPGRVFFIPLGIDTEFFTPAASQDKYNGDNPRIVFSGHWLRDTKTLYEVVLRLVQQRQDIAFDLLVPVNRRREEYFEKLAAIPQVCWHAGLPDEQLREIYRRAALLFIPYLSCTASCALLEAMACGLPIVSTPVGGIPAYTDPAFAELLPVGDVEGFTRTILELLADPLCLQEKGERAREYVKAHFSWDIITAKTLQVYEKR